MASNRGIPTKRSQTRLRAIVRRTAPREARLIGPAGIGKTRAERMAWAFMGSHQPTFKLTTILPAYVIGPRPYQPLNDEDALRASTAGGACLSRRAGEG